VGSNGCIDGFGLLCLVPAYHVHHPVQYTCGCDCALRLVSLDCERRQGKPIYK
jgi:hypothetical protein